MQNRQVNSGSPPRARAPVFVVGCPRSGTTLLYDMLLSAGNFAVYLTESNVFNLLGQRFGDLGVKRHRRKAVDVWLQSRLFKVSSLHAAEIREKLLADCRSTGDFLRLLMEEIARQQGVKRWADNSPEELLYLPAIKRSIPNALVIHIIRDGRDVALSLGRRPRPWVKGFPWDQEKRILTAALYWEWMVDRGRRYGRALGDDYMEVRFEQLVADPRATLADLGRFIDQELDYDHIQRVGLGCVSRPNSTFKKGACAADFSPVGRWRAMLPSDRIAALEVLIGRTLNELGYPLLGTAAPASNQATLSRMRACYRVYFECKFWLKNSLVGRMLRPPLTAQVLDEVVIG